MFLLGKIRDYFKTEFGWNESISVGRIDQNRDKAICFYHSRHAAEKPTALGGKANRSFDFLPVTILLRWTDSPVEACKKAQEIFNFFDEKNFTINGRRGFVISRYEMPIDIGSDERGICEYTLELDFYFNKE